MSDPASARREAEEALANVTSADLECSTTSVVACVMALRALLAATEPAPEPVSNAYTLPEEVREAAIRAFRDLLSEPADLESPASLVASGMWEKGDDAAPFWSEAGLYGRVGKEAARTLLYRHRKATEALAALAAFLWRHRNCRSAEMEVLP